MEPLLIITFIAGMVAGLVGHIIMIDDEYIDDLILQADSYGIESLTEDEQAILENSLFRFSFLS